jgi:hypothetical protein
MAKRKHSTALFEVIKHAPHYARPKAHASEGKGVLAVARRWLKASPQQASAVAPPDSDLPVRALAAPVVPRVDVEPLEEAPPAAIGFEDHALALAGSAAAADFGDLTAPPPAQNLHVAVDPERRQIALRLSYTAAMIGGFALLVIVALCVMVGQHFRGNGAPLLAQSTTADLRKGLPHRDVMTVPRRSLAPISSDTPQGQGPTAQGPAHPAGNALAERRGAAPPAATDSQASPTAAGDGKRYIGLNYVIVQSYPEAERKMADDAAAFLNREGVSCTVETGVKGYLAVTVVGLQGFDRQSSPAFKSYVQRIQQLSTKYATGTRSYKAFTPVAKKWDKQD